VTSALLKPPTVRHKRKKTNDSGILLQKDKKEKNDKMKSRRTKLHICKPRHTSQCFSLQKSSFLAEAPAEIDTFTYIDNDFNTGF
jgi:hypothetical protein